MALTNSTLKANKGRLFRLMQKKFASGFMRDVYLKDGVPSEHAERIGDICLDTSNDDVYIATDTSGTWVKFID